MSGVDRKATIIPRVGFLVKRFHTLPTIVEETVGHHSANVALICDILTDGEASKEIIIAALKHDIPEQWTGDIPAPAKWIDPNFNDMIKKVEKNWATQTGYKIPELVGDDLLVLKAADMLDLCFKCVEEITLGNVTFMPIFINGIHYLSKLPLQGKVAGNVMDICSGLKATLGIKDEPTIITTPTH